MPRIIRPGEDRFARSFKNLRYMAAQRSTVTVGSYDAEYQICHITFAKRDGSIFVSFPYLPETAGLLSIAKFPEDQTGSVTLSFGDDARSTSHLAKYSHHPDGLVLFSQDGKIRSEVRRRSFRLDGPLVTCFSYTCIRLADSLHLIARGASPIACTSGTSFKIAFQTRSRFALSGGASKAL